MLRGADERPKPNTERLREYADTSIPRIEQLLFASVPVYTEFETMTLSFSLERMREWLGPDNPVVRRLLTTDTPDSLATRLMSQTKLNDCLLYTSTAALQNQSGRQSASRIGGQQHAVGEIRPAVSEILGEARHLRLIGIADEE